MTEPSSTEFYAEESFVYADVPPGPPGLPARFRAPLATSGSIDAYAPDRPPLDHVWARLAAGDPDMAARVTTAIERWTESDRTLAYGYGDLLGGVAARHPDARPLIRAVLEQAPAGRRDALVSRVVLRCKDARFTELAAAAGPIATIACWTAGLQLDDSAPPPLQDPRDRARILDAARAVFADPRRSDRGSLVEGACIDALDLLAQLPEAGPVVADLARRIGPDDHELRARLAQLRAPRRVIAAEAPSVRGTPFGWTDAHARDANRAIELDGGARAYLAAKPEDLAWVVMALELRARDSAVAGADRLRALAQLLELDRGSALALADTARDDPALAPLARPLSQFRTPVALDRYLAELGLLDGVAGETADRWQLPPRRLRHLVFDPRTSQFPCGHDRWLRDLATLVDELDALAPWFDEIPPMDDDEIADEIEDEPATHARRDPGDERLSSRYRLRAYLSHGSYEAIIEAERSWLNTTVMVGLLNRICADAGLAHRFLEVVIDDVQRVCVIAGPEPALERAVADGVVRCAGPTADEP